MHVANAFLIVSLAAIGSAHAQAPKVSGDTVKAAGTDDGPAVANKMRELPINDMTVQNGSILPNGRVLQDMYLVRVKAPSASTKPWDYYEVLSTIPGKDVFLSYAESGCQPG